jgi:hypothetical protein
MVHSTTYCRTAYHNPFAHTDPRNLRSDLEGNSSVSFNSFDIACSGGSVWIPKLTTGLSSSSRTITASPEIPSERGGGHSSSSKAKKMGLTDHVEGYDVEHKRIEPDDMLAMMRVLMEARPRLIKGMDGLAGKSRSRALPRSARSPASHSSS